MSTYTVQTASGVVTSWLSMPTGFSAPPACFTGIYSQQGSAGQLIAFDPFYQSIVPSFTTACFPEQATLWYNQGTDPLSTVTSLGPFACPGGYTTAFTSADSPQSTQIACCPTYVLRISSFLIYDAELCEAVMRIKGASLIMAQSGSAGRPRNPDQPCSTIPSQTLVPGPRPVLFWALHM